MNPDGPVMGRQAYLPAKHPIFLNVVVPLKNGLPETDPVRNSSARDLRH